MNQCVRIIGGKYRGKKLPFPIAEGLRPTPDRVKETLFNWLMHDIRAARCLDAFAGSGALGFEALSRGAAEVVMVEQSATVFSHLKKIAPAFADEKLLLWQGDALLYLQKEKKPFDIIFLDPPFSGDCLTECVAIIANKNSLRQGGLLYIESPTNLTLPAEMWHQRKIKRAGQVFYMLYEKL